MKTIIVDSKTFITDGKTNEALKKELNSLKSTDNLIILTADGNLQINTEIFSMLQGLKAKMNILAGNSIENIAFLYGYYSGMPQSTVVLQLNNVKDQKRITDCKEALLSPGKTKRTSKNKPKADGSEQISKETAPEQTENESLVTKKPAAAKKTVAKPAAVVNKTKEDNFDAFLESLDTKEFKVSEYKKVIMQSCKEAASGKKLADCMKNNLKDIEVTKRVLSVLAPKSKELSHYVTEELKHV